MTRTLAAKVIEGLRDQGWEIIGYGGTWTGAMHPLEEYVKRKVERAVKAEREAMLDLVDEYAKGNTDLKSAIRARGEKK